MDHGLFIVSDFSILMSYTSIPTYIPTSEKHYEIRTQTEYPDRTGRSIDRPISAYTGGNTHPLIDK
jgi:hypothetical protein